MANWAKTYLVLTARAHYAVTLWSGIIDETNQNLVGVGILECNHFISYRMLVLAKSVKRIRVLCDPGLHTPHFGKPHCHLHVGPSMWCHLQMRGSR